MPTGRIVVDVSWGTASGSPGVNVFHARGDSTVDINPDFNVLSEMLETFYADINQQFPSTLTFSQNGEVTGVGDDTGSVWSTDPWTVTGVAPDNYLPPANCMLVNWRAATGGRSGRGKTFLGPLNDNVSEANGTPEESSRVDVQNAVDALIASSTGFGNGALGIYSRTQDIFRDFVSGNVPNDFAVLRSRRD